METQIIPWWVKSPSPFTIIMYGLISLYGYKKIESESRIYKYIKALTILGLVVLFGDLQWCIFQLVRFYYLHPESLNQMLFSILRDGFGLVYCYLISKPFFNNGLIEWNWSIWILNIIFFMIWFSLASTPAQTDWTYALRYGYGWSQAIKTFFISHILGRLVTGVIYIDLWR